MPCLVDSCSHRLQVCRARDGGNNAINQRTASTSKMSQISLIHHKSTTLKETPKLSGLRSGRELRAIEFNIYLVLESPTKLTSRMHPPFEHPLWSHCFPAQRHFWAAPVVSTLSQWAESCSSRSSAPPSASSSQATQTARYTDQLSQWGLALLITYISPLIRTWYFSKSTSEASKT